MSSHRQQRMKHIFERIINEIPENKEILVIKNNSNHIIDSSINLFDLIEKHFGEEEAYILFKKFILAIKKKNKDKFNRKLKEIIRKHGKKNGS